MDSISKVPVMLCTDFQSILKPVDEQCREKSNKIKTVRKGNTLYTEKNTHTSTLRILCTHPVCVWRFS